MSAKTQNSSPTITGVNPIKHVCLITPGNLSSTPRLLREAQSLRKHGYQVSVIAGTLFAPLEAADRSLATANDFNFIKPARPAVLWLLDRTLSKLARCCAKWSLPLPFSLEALALNPITWSLTQSAQSISADIYIGHCLAGLYAAVRSAKSNGAISGFDIEDFHAAEQNWESSEKWKPAAIHHQMQTLLPDCAHLTSASPGIQTEILTHYNIRSEVLLNTYPLSEAPAKQTTLPSPTKNSPAKLYWFSQTIGPDRGLEEALRIIAVMHTPCELYLRGYIQGEYRQFLIDLAVGLGLKQSQLIFLVPAAADQMVKLSSGYHLGLCLEHSIPKNRDLCLTNKIFSYLLAGTPLWLSSTTAHRQLFPQLNEAACMTDVKEKTQSAEQLDRFLTDTIKYSKARHESWQLGQNLYHWDKESLTFLNLIRTHLTHSNE